MWESLCTVIDRKDLINDPRFSERETRLENRETLKAEIERWTSRHDKYDAMRQLAEGGVPASAVLDTKDLYENPHLNSRGFVHEVEHAVHGNIKLLGWPARMSESSVALSAAPLLGQHSGEILAEDLGLDADELAELVGAGVVAMG